MIQILEGIFVTRRIIAFEIYNSICRKQRKNKSLTQFHGDFSPIVKTVKPYCNNGKEGSNSKTSIGLEKINIFIHKNKYQIPNIELLHDNIAQIIKTKENKPTLLSTLGL